MTLSEYLFNLFLIFFVAFAVADHASGLGILKTLFERLM